jgi:hypothetical protein
MAAHDPSVLLFEQQPPYPTPPKSEAAQMDEILMVLNVAERMPILSQSILDGFKQGEDHKSLARKFFTLHANLIDLAETAVRAKYIEF